MKIIKFTILLLFFSQILVSQNNDIENYFKEGTNAMQQQNFNKAIKSFNQLVALNINSAELFYNLGTAYFQKNDVANSIYFLEKAKKINPKDEAITKNLNIAYKKQTDDIDKFPELLIVSILKNIANYLSSNIWFILAFLSFCTALFCFYKFANLKFFNKNNKRGFYTWFAFLLLGLFFVLLSNLKYNNDFGYKAAIIFAKETIVLKAPNKNAEELITIHEGLKVNVIDAVDDWIKVELSNKTKGWLPKSELKII